MQHRSMHARTHINDGVAFKSWISAMAMPKFGPYMPNTSYGRVHDRWLVVYCCQSELGGDFLQPKRFSPRRGRTRTRENVCETNNRREGRGCRNVHQLWSNNKPFSPKTQLLVFIILTFTHILISYAEEQGRFYVSCPAVTVKQYASRWYTQCDVTKGTDRSPRLVTTPPTVWDCLVFFQTCGKFNKPSVLAGS